MISSFTSRRSVLSLVLLLSLFSNTVFAIPEAPRHIAFAVSGNVADTWQDFSRTGLVAMIVNLPMTVFAFISKTAKGNKKNQITRIEISPGNATILRGESTNFSATAYNGETAVAGVPFRWTVTPVEGGKPRQYRSGVFIARHAGQFTVSVSAEGQEATVRLTVVRDEGFDRTALLRKPASERTEAENRQYEAWLKSGELRVRELDSRMPQVITPTETIVKNEVKSRGPSDSNEPAFLAPPLGWDSDDWAAADDRNNWVGRPNGAAEDARAGNGNFLFAAPAVSMPGRGIDVDLNLYYNSRVWSKVNSSEMKYDADSGFPAPGWNLGFGKLHFPAYPAGCIPVAPDGTRRSATGTSYYYSSGSFVDHSYTGNTTDGSFIDFTCNYYQNGSTVVGSGQSKHPDGTTITYGAGTTQLFPTKIVDAKGNWIQITYKNGAGPEISTITDTLGRTITFNYDSSDRLINITGPGYNGATRTFLRLHYTTTTLGHAFNTSVITTTTVPDSTPDLIDSIYYPTTETGYSFADSDSYSPYGMIAKIETQRGMSWSGSSGTQGTVNQGSNNRVETYNYPMSANSSLIDAPMYSNLTEDWEGNDTPNYTPCAGGTTNHAVTCYSISGTTDEIITVVRPDGSKSKQTSYNTGTYEKGMWYQTEILNPSNTVLDKTRIYIEQGAYNSPRTTKIQHTDESSQTTTTEFGYGSAYNRVISQKDYGYTSSTLYREKKFTYKDGVYVNSNRHIYYLIGSVEEYDGSANRLTRTVYDYDQYSLVAASGIVQHLGTHDPHTTDLVEGEPCLEWSEPECLSPECECLEWSWVSAYDPDTAYRGDLTSVTTYETVTTGSATGAITHDYTYDIAGNQRTASTDCCQEVSTVYSTATQFSRPDSQTRGSSNPSSPDRMTQTFTYDANTVLPTNVEDYNGNDTTMTYDATSRPLITTLNSGAKTTVTYNDSSLSRTELVQKSTAEGSGTVSNSTSYFNGRGQVNKSTYQAGTLNHNATSIKYDVMGRQWKVSRPYDTGSSPSDWSESVYDYLGRVTTQTAPDGSANSMNYNPSAPSNASSNVGRTVITSDAWGRERWVRNDAYGRLVEVVEPDPGSTSAAVSASGNLSTTYSYDTLDRLTTITQGSQTRSFKYDSLGRMTRQKLAEQTATINDAGNYVTSTGSGAAWSEAFVYDSRSNLTQRTDARGVKTNLTYTVSSALDPLNRLQKISYDSSVDVNIPTVPDTTFEYMTTGDKTRVKKVDTAGVAEEENAFDSEGRIAEYKLTLDSRTSYPFETDYTYDSSHRLTQIDYPKAWGMSGDPRKAVVPSYDETSRLTGLTVDAASILSNVVYNTSSQVTSLTTSTSTTARVEAYSYDSQTGLLTGQTVKNTAGTTTYMDLAYTYSRGNSYGSASGKTGQLTKIVDNLDRNRDKLYEFDAVGRMLVAKGGLAAGATGVTANWSQTYSYDRYGNKLGATPSGVDQNSASIVADGLPSVTASTSTNRITTSGWEYDLTGNLIRGQNISGVWQKFEYDAAGRLFKVKDDSNNPMETYTYGASREKLKVETSTQKTYYAWGGQSIIAEYTEPTSSSTPTYAKSYIYAGSRLLATYAPTSTTKEAKQYHHPDRLGTQLVTTGASTSFRQTTFAFGTTISAETTGNSNQVFTSYDRSGTTGLDSAQNRTYSQGQSRFTQVDPIGMASAAKGNPQSNNLYAYVRNMPSDLLDPSGLNANSGGYYTWTCYVTWTSNADGSNFRITSVSCQNTGYVGTGTNGMGGDVSGQATNAYNQFKSANKGCSDLAKKLGLDKDVEKASFTFPGDEDLKKTFKELGFTADDVGDVNSPLSSALESNPLGLTNFRNNTVYLFGDAFIEDPMLPNEVRDTLYLGSTVFHEALHLKFDGGHEKIAKKLGLDYDKSSKDKGERDDAAAAALDKFISAGCKK